MTKSSKAVTLVLIGSAAALAGYNVTHRTPASDFGPAETDFVDERDADGRPTTRSYTSSHSSGTGSHSRTSTGWWIFGGSSSGGRTAVGSSGGARSSSSSGSSSSSTSRGGFGSTGHAASSGS